MSVRFNDLPEVLSANDDDMIAILRSDTDSVALVRVSDIRGGGGGGGGASRSTLMRTDDNTSCMATSTVANAIAGTQWMETGPTVVNPYTKGQSILMRDGRMGVAKANIAQHGELTSSNFAVLPALNAYIYRYKGLKIDPTTWTEGLIYNKFKFDGWYVSSDADVDIYFDSPAQVESYGRVLGYISGGTLYVYFENGIIGDPEGAVITFDVVVNCSVPVVSDVAMTPELNS